MAPEHHRIAIFVPSLSGGGAERVMMILANHFADLGYPTDLVLARAEGSYLELVSPKVNVVDLGASRVIVAVPALVRYFRNAQPSVMLSALAHANVAAILARRLSGVQCRLVVSERANLSVSALNAKSLRAKMMKRFVSWTYPRADHVITVSKGVASDLVAGLGLRSEQVTAVYNPVVDEALLAKSREELNEPWFEDSSVPVVVGAGRLAPQKDFETLIRAIGRVRAEMPVRLVILGEGPLREELMNLVEDLELADHVRLPGFIANPFPYMRRASLFVLSSAWEGLPGTLIQAMACGAPVVSTDCPDGPLEILEKGKWGALVPVGDSEAMADAITSALSKSSHPDVTARAHDFSVENAVRDYLAILLPGDHGAPRNAVEVELG